MMKKNIDFLTHLQEKLPLKELPNWEMLVESHICLPDKITNTTISTNKTYFKN